jgi:hypothetical protein
MVRSASVDSAPDDLVCSLNSLCVAADTRSMDERRKDIGKTLNKAAIGIDGSLSSNLLCWSLCV